MKKLIKFFTVFWLSFFMLQVAHASPVATVKKAANNVLSALKKNKANLRTNPSYVYKVVNRYIIPHVDVYGMSRSVLGRNAWMKATAQQKKKFSRLFTQLVVRTYSGSLRDYSGETIKFSRSSGGGKYSKVSSYIVRPNGRNISVKYSLVRKGGGWKVYDMSVEGVSLLQSFRSQFKRELIKGNLNQLIAKLQSRKAGKKR